MVLGFFSFTEITDPTLHGAYNQWHQFDHLPEQFTVDGIVFGQRWVASPRCQQARVQSSLDRVPRGFGRTGCWAAPRVLVSPGAVPYRPAAGVYVVVGPALDGAALVARDGVAGAWQFADAAGESHITVAFLDTDLLATAAHLGPWCQDLGAPLEWAGPLETIDPNRWDWFDRLTGP